RWPEHDLADTGAIHEFINEVVRFVNYSCCSLRDLISRAKLDVVGKHVVADRIGDARRHLRAACIFEVDKATLEGWKFFSEPEPLPLPPLLRRTIHRRRRGATS